MNNEMHTVLAFCETLTMEELNELRNALKLQAHKRVFTSDAPAVGGLPGALTPMGEAEARHTFQTGAQRSQVMPRYDLIPQTALRREALRFTGERDIHGMPDGGALKYGEGNWERGLPTSDVLNHAIEHLTKYADAFRTALTTGLNGFAPGAPIPYDKVIHVVQMHMREFSKEDDHLAAVRWACGVLMTQEEHGFHHDSRFAKEGTWPSKSETESAGPSTSTPLSPGASARLSPLGKPFGA